MCANTENGEFFIFSYYLWSHFILCVISYMAVVMNMPEFFIFELNIVLNNHCSEQYPDSGQ